LDQQSKGQEKKEEQAGTEFTKHHHKGKHQKKENRCHTMAYNMQQSSSGIVLQNNSVSLAYGSANLQGFLWKDYTCLQPLNLGNDASNLTNGTFLAHVTDKNDYHYSIKREKQFLEQAYDFQKENKCSLF